MIKLIALIVTCIAFIYAVQNYRRLNRIEKEAKDNFRPAFKKITHGDYTGHKVYIDRDKRGFFLLLEDSDLNRKGFSYKSALVFKVALLSMFEVSVDDFEPINDEKILEWLKSIVINMNSRDITFY